MYRIGSSTSSSNSNFRIFLLSVVCCLMTACGFHPVYETDDGNPTSAKLANVKVEKVVDKNKQESRPTQILQNDLENLLNPANVPSSNDYSLNIEMTLTRQDLGLQNDLRVTRYNVNATATYHLIRLSDNREVDTGSVSTQSSFNRTVSEFSTYVAEQNSNELASKELAEEIHQRLMYYFSK